MPRRPKVKRPLTIADLPAASTNRWVIRRKAEVIAAVHDGLVSLEEVCRRYTLTVEEFLSWQSLIDRYGTTCESASNSDPQRHQRKSLTRNLFRGKRWGPPWTPIGFPENRKFRNCAKYLDHERGGVKVRRRFTPNHPAIRFTRGSNFVASLVRNCYGLPDSRLPGRI